MKSIPANPETIKNVTPAELTQLNELLTKRTNIACQLGQMEYEFTLAKNKYIQAIAEIEEEQRVMGTMAIKNSGIKDLDKNNYSIDHATGEIVKGK